jgi:hypothetical protein
MLTIFSAEIEKEAVEPRSGRDVRSDVKYKNEKRLPREALSIG